MPSGDAATHEIGPLQHAHVLGGGWERHPQRRGELAEVALPAGELPDDRAAGGVGERMEDEIEPWGLIVRRPETYVCSTLRVFGVVGRQR